MPNPNAVVARVNTISPAAGAPRVGPEAATPEAMIVNFEGDRTAVLAPGRRAEVWRRMLEFTRQYGMPAYVETDPETSVITRVLIPMRVRVVAIEPAANGDIDVRFIESHAGHHLLRNNPDFQDMLNALEAARAAGTEVLVTSTRDEHEIIDVRPAPPVPAPVDDFEDPPPSVVSAAPSVVSEAQAAQLFNDMAVTTCAPLNILAPCIPFLFPDDGCYARAHEMIRLMRLTGIEGEKIWIFASGDTNLKPNTANHPACKVAWWYHVAPTLQVNTPSGIEKRVIDPSLMTGPATADAWRTRQNDPTATFQFTDARPYYPNYGGNDDSYDQTNKDLQFFRLKLQERVILDSPPPYPCPMEDTMNWALTGNSGIDPATNFLGTLDNQPLAIKTNGKEAARITAEGNIGIGTNAPTHKLDVAGIAAQSDDGMMVRSKDGWLSILPSRALGGNSPLVAAGDSSIIYSGGPIDTGALVIGQWSNSARGLKIHANGNIGIGFSEPPAGRVSIVGNSSDAYVLRAENTDVGGAVGGVARGGYPSVVGLALGAGAGVHGHAAQNANSSIGVIGTVGQPDPYVVETPFGGEVGVLGTCMGGLVSG